MTQEAQSPRCPESLIEQGRHVAFVRSLGIDPGRLARTGTVRHMSSASQRCYPFAIEGAWARVHIDLDEEKAYIEDGNTAWLRWYADGQERTYAHYDPRGVRAKAVSFRQWVLQAVSRCGAPELRASA